MHILSFITFNLFLFHIIERTNAIQAGFAFGLNNKILETSRQYLLEHLQQTLNQDIALADFTVPFLGDNHLYQNRIALDHFQASDVSMYFHGDKLYVQVDHLGGMFFGKSWHKNIFGHTETFSYRASGMRGTFYLSYQIIPSWEYVDGYKIPIPVVTNAKFQIRRRDLVDINLYTNDVGPKLIEASIKTFQGLFLDKVESRLNGGFLNSMINAQINHEVTSSKG